MAELAGVVSFFAAYGGWLLIALCQRRHAAAVYGGSGLDGSERARAVIGSGLLLGSTLIAIQAHGASFGSLFGVLALCLAAVAVTLTLAFRPTWARTVAKVLMLGTAR